MEQLQQMEQNEQLDSALLVFAGHVGDAVRGYSLSEGSRQALAFARGLSSGPVIALALVPTPDLADLAKLGVDQVLQVDVTGSDPTLASVLSQCVLAAVDHLGAADTLGAVIFPPGQLGKEAAARVAVARRGAVTCDVTQVRVEQGRLVAAKAVLDGAWQTTYRLGGSGDLAVLALGAGLPMPGGELTDEPKQLSAQPLSVEFSGSAKNVFVESDEPAGQGADLASASAVVCVGRGIDGDLAPAQALAQKLGAALGATRVAVDEGWMDRSTQIGQTGAAISPQLYVGLGVSGAIHHTCAIRGAKTIVAVCDDAEAPIFELCDFGIVGDVSQVVPAVLEQLG